jgi:hypothetical protein
MARLIYKRMYWKLRIKFGNKIHFKNKNEIKNGFYIE